MIGKVELAVIERLKKGLGKLARNVKGYGGEFDDGALEVAKLLPCVYVVFDGIVDTSASSTRRQKFKVEARYSVIVVTRSVRSEAASRLGGPSSKEIGSYDLIYAVRRLLAAQDLGIEGLDSLRPEKVTSLFNGKAQGKALSVFACQFSTRWYENALDNGRYPISIDTSPGEVQPGDVKSDEWQPGDEVFVQHEAQLDEPLPMLKEVASEVYDGDAKLQFHLETKGQVND